MGPIRQLTNDLLITRVLSSSVIRASDQSLEDRRRGFSSHLELVYLSF